jgi:methenyltetrahydrofolate cyclohydrolase
VRLLGAAADSVRMWREMTPDARFGDLTVAAFVDQLASAAPVPGGGSAAAVSGSLAAALVTMVASLSEGRPAYAAHAALHAVAIVDGRALAQRFLALADEDAEAFASYARALKLPRATDVERELRGAAIRQAARGAAEVPFRTIGACAEVAALAEALAGRSNRNAASDLAVAALLAVAAAESAAANVAVNLPAIGDEPMARDLSARTDGLMREIREVGDRARALVAAGEEREPVERLAR